MKKSIAVILLGSALVLPNSSQAEASTLDSAQVNKVVKTIQVEGNLQQLPTQLKYNKWDLQAYYNGLASWLIKHYVKPQEKPVEKPDTPVEKPDTPVEKPDTPVEKPDTPVEKPDTPVEKPDTPVEKPDTPVEKPDTPVEKPDTPVEKPDTPVEKPTPPTNPTPEEKPDQTPGQGQVSASQIEKAVLTLTNAERQKAGLKPLQMDDKLMKTARAKSADMASKNYFSHTSPTYGSPFDQMKANGITYRAAAENIAMGQRSAEEVVKGWMNSPGHRQNILTPGFTHIGIGYDAKGNYWTQQFIQK
ncbi:CAP domain-containing protein [Sporosarcina aquimarina]|uniref:CAP domain-containing protein n=1 Tax=Sporosarcina aquimarina TaxID=114975 RepID=UPI00203F6D8E|nr:CAP domain-containing protein [Sporosarcina aquimarina]MCM3758176.1 CAP domain-containing protein [Sporosarcina aquimarina]